MPRTRCTQFEQGQSKESLTVFECGLNLNERLKTNIDLKQTNEKKTLLWIIGRDKIKEYYNLFSI